MAVSQDTNLWRCVEVVPNLPNIATNVKDPHACRTYTIPLKRVLIRAITGEIDISSTSIRAIRAWVLACLHLLTKPWHNPWEIDMPSASTRAIITRILPCPHLLMKPWQNVQIDPCCRVLLPINNSTFFLMRSYMLPNFEIHWDSNNVHHPSFVQWIWLRGVSNHHWHKCMSGLSMRWMHILFPDITIEASCTISCLGLKDKFLLYYNYNSFILKRKNKIWFHSIPQQIWSIQ